MLLAELNPTQKKQLKELDNQIAKLTAEANKLKKQLDSRLPKTSGDAWFRLTHAILNSKELIYVH